MKKKIASIIDNNWGLMGPGEWERTKWIVYDDCSLEKEEYYYLLTEENTSIEDLESVRKGRRKRKKVVLNEGEVNHLISLFDNCVQKKFASVDACDGDAWEFEYYKDGKLLWKREIGYIYSIEELEEIALFISKY